MVSTLIKIPPEIVNKATFFGEAVYELKKHYSSSRYLNPESHKQSKVGEWVFAHAFGLEGQIDWSVKPEGDQYDFMVNGVTIDVKTTTYWRYPELKCFPTEKKSDVLVLVSLNHENYMGRVVGWVSREELFDEKNYLNYRGLGYRYVKTGKQLNKDWSWLKRA